MKLMEILKKLGIVRCEGKAVTYTSGKDRPLEFIDDIDTDQGASTSTSNDTATSHSE